MAPGTPRGRPHGRRMSAGMEELGWPLERLGEALAELSRRGGLSPREAPLPGEAPRLGALSAWVEGAATWLGVEAEPIATMYAEAEAMVEQAAPAILQLPGEATRFLLVLSGGRQIRVLGPGLRVCRLRATAVCGALRWPLDATLAAEVERALADAGVPPGRRPRARAAILRRRLGQSRIAGGWLLRRGPGAGLGRRRTRDLALRL